MRTVGQRTAQSPQKKISCGCPIACIGSENGVKRLSLCLQQADTCTHQERKNSFTGIITKSTSGHHNPRTKYGLYPGALRRSVLWELLSAQEKTSCNVSLWWGNFRVTVRFLPARKGNPGKHATSKKQWEEKRGENPQVTPTSDGCLC